MSEAQWGRLWDLFHDALEKPAPQREVWLAEACAGETILLAEVRALLVGHAAAAHPLDRVPRAVAVDEELSGGSAIGRWRVVQTLGQGGMGRVYLVERDDGEYRQRAALKLIDPTLAQHASVENFLRERQILAQLEHPRIARLLDGGHTDEGLPFLVMDYVDGIAIDRWCAQHAASWRERVRLLIAVCETVDFAHRQLIVHRDIKPGNVLVTRDGQPMLLDFGIARPVPQRDEEAIVADASLALTPRYASPEQLTGALVGPAADIYSLGVLLFELCAGVPPFEFGAVSIAERAQRLRTQRPARLRDVAKDTKQKMPPELDWICARALEAEPAARYRSAHAMGDDLQALLAHRPVSARVTTPLYRARKFLRRHWAAAAVALLFLATVIGFVVRLSDETARTREALAQTRIERDRAERVAGFLSELFRLADTTQARGAVVSAQEVLDRGRAQLAARTDLPPVSRVPLLNSLAEVYRNMGVYGAAVELLQEARSLLGQIDSRALEAETLDNLGATLELQGEHAPARAALQQALSLRRSLPDGNAVALARTQERLAATLQSLGQKQEAGALFREAYELRAQSLPAEDPRRADGALRYGSWFWVAGRLDDAERYYGVALAARRAQQPQDLPELARTIDAMGALQHARGRYAEACMMYAEAIALRRRVLGAKHRFTADSLSNLGACRFDMNDDAAAEPALREALAIYPEVLPGDSPVLAKTLNNLGLVRQRQQAPAEARELFERALAINRKAYGDKHARVAGNLNNLALVAEAEDDLAAAESALREAVAINEEVLGAAHAQLAFPLTNLGRVLLWRDRREEARPLLERALAIRREQLPPRHPALAESLAWLGYARCLAGARDDGAALIEEAHALRIASVVATDLSVFDLRVLRQRCGDERATKSAASPLSEVEFVRWIVAHQRDAFGRLAKPSTAATRVQP